MLASVIAFAAWRLRALTGGGALAAAFVGAAVFGSGGWRNAAVLFAFFLSSILLSRVGFAKKRRLDVSKTGPRDGAQVFANGGIAAVCALAAMAGNPVWQVAFAAAFATATADTWGTEVGTLGTSAPRSILSGKRIEPGLSGGVSAAGSLAAICGAVLVAAVAWAARASPAFFAVAIGGLAGSLVDSLLGASMQALRFCRGCNRYCESDPHRCGADTILVRGAAWMGNDGVNFIATAAGASIAAAMYALRR